MQLKLRNSDQTVMGMGHHAGKSAQDQIAGQQDGGGEPMDDPGALFRDTTRRIGEEYAQLGYDLGWRFLYSPRVTFGPDTVLAFFGINPGGNVFEAPLASVEQGNAYRTERWLGNGASLQREVQALFQSLATELGRSDGWQAIMDATLTANVCPFRSPTWDALPNRADAIRFSLDLWAGLWEVLRPRAVVCNGSDTLALMAQVFLRAGYVVTASDILPSGWGGYGFTIKSFNHPARGKMLVVGLPHLSRFRVMTSFRCRDARRDLVARLAAALAEPRLFAPTGATLAGQSTPAHDHAPPSLKPPAMLPMAPANHSKEKITMTGAQSGSFLERFRVRYGQHLSEYKVRLTGRYLVGPWENGIHLSFGALRNSASVRFNLRSDGPGTLAEHEAEVHKLLGAAGTPYRPGLSKTGQSVYASFNVIPEQPYRLPEQEAELFSWMIRCWHVFEDYRQRLT